MAVLWRLAACLLAVALPGASTGGLRGIPPRPRYDGVLRSTADGRKVAYLKPPFKSNHASMVEVARNGTLVMAWFSGVKEGASKCSIAVSKWAPGSEAWSDAAVVSVRKGFSNQNPVLYFDDATGTLHLWHTQQVAKKKEEGAIASGVAGAEGSSTVWHLASEDGAGAAWSHPVLAMPKHGTFLRNRLLTRPAGGGEGAGGEEGGEAWLLPTYSAAGPSSSQHSTLHVSKDRGSTWAEADFPKSSFLVQPSIIPTPGGGGGLLTFFRDRRASWVYAASSGDGGTSWSPPLATVIPNNNAGIEAMALASGAVAIVFNNARRGRTPLSIALSKDGGGTWPFVRDLEDANSRPSPSPEAPAGVREAASGRPPLLEAPGAGAGGGEILTAPPEFSYPTLLEAPGGEIHISYTYNREAIKHVVIREEWIVSGPPSKGMFKGN